jgi:hypothetical protein
VQLRKEGVGYRDETDMPQVKRKGDRGLGVMKGIDRLSLEVKRRSDHIYKQVKALSYQLTYLKPTRHPLHLGKTTIRIQQSTQLSTDQTTSMLALLVPLLALFPAAHSLPAHQDFEESVRINFNLNNQTFPKFGWNDITKYLDLDDRHEMSTNLQKPDNETVAILNLRYVGDIRNISWTKAIMEDTVREVSLASDDS